MERKIKNDRITHPSLGVASRYIYLTWRPAKNKTKLIFILDSQYKGYKKEEREQKYFFVSSYMKNNFIIKARGL